MSGIDIEAKVREILSQHADGVEYSCGKENDLEIQVDAANKATTSILALIEGEVRALRQERDAYREALEYYKGVKVNRVADATYKRRKHGR